MVETEKHRKAKKWIVEAKHTVEWQLKQVGITSEYEQKLLNWLEITEELEVSEAIGW